MSVAQMTPGAARLETPSARRSTRMAAHVCRRPCNEFEANVSNLCEIWRAARK